MKDEILDEIEYPIEVGIEEGGLPVYANKSFNQFLLSILIYILFYLSEIHAFDLLGGNVILSLIVVFILGVTAFLLNLFGMINAAKSERFQEVTTWKKYVGAVGNMLLFLPSAIFIFVLFVSSVVYFIELV